MTRTLDLLLCGAMVRGAKEEVDSANAILAVGEGCNAVCGVFRSCEEAKSITGWFVFLQILLDVSGRRLWHSNVGEARGRVAWALQSLSFGIIFV